MREWRIHCGSEEWQGAFLQPGLSHPVTTLDRQESLTTDSDRPSSALRPPAPRQQNHREIDLGSELGESRSAATAVAPAPDGAGAHTDHEPAAGGGAQRRPALQETALARCRTGATGVVCISALGKPATARPAGVAGPTDAHDCRTDASHRGGSGEVS